MIGSSVRTMKKFIVMLAKDDLKAYEKIVINKNVHALRVQQLSTKCLVYKSIDVPMGQVRSIKFFESTVSYPQELVDLPLLSELSFERCLINPEMESFTLPHLTKLSIRKSKGFPRVAAEDTLTHFSFGQQYQNFDIFSIVRFLLDHHKLTSLKLSELTDVFAFAEIVNVKFRLKKFGLHLMSDSEAPKVAVEVLQRNFIAFINVHKATLTDLSIYSYINAETLNIFLTQIPNLTRLEINVSKLTTETSFYLCLPPLNQVKKLKLVGKFPNHEAAKLFIRSFPCVENLDMLELKTSIWSAKFLKTIASHQPNIEMLSVSSFFSGTSQNLKFKKLRCLRVGTVASPVKMWLNFVMSHRDLESVIVDKFVDVAVNESDIDNLFSLPHLRHIYLRGRRKSLRKVLDQILKGNFKNLQIAELVNSRLTSKDEICKIVFPSSKKDWNPLSYESFFLPDE